MEHKQVLRTCQVFEDLDEAQAGKIGGLCRMEEYEAGAAIFTVNGPAKDAYVLEAGKVALQMKLPRSLGQQGGRVTIDIVTPSELFGWSACVEAHSYMLTAVCLEPTKVLAIDGTGLRSMLTGDHDIGYLVLESLIKVVARRLDEARQLLISERQLGLV
ncbi:MAG: cyclic nucleotide-binding domain-containing protein [Chloroflexi bacterium]|nr:cyclic nucleotide-binding domain-containing protein [Chloroflexota bacterium]